MKFVFWVIPMFLRWVFFIPSSFAAPCPWKIREKTLPHTDREKRISSIIIQKRPKIPCLLQQNNKKIGLHRRRLATNICKNRLPPPWIYIYIFQELILKSHPKRHPCRWIFDLGSRLQTSEKHFKALITRQPPQMRKCLLAFAHQPSTASCFRKMVQGPLICLTLLGPSVLHDHRSLAFGGTLKI